MMKPIRTLAAMTSGVFAIAIATPAYAVTAAGWDFSQWFVAGVLSVDGINPANMLDANYSSFDPTFGAGAEAAAFGTLFFDGSFGSTEVVPTGMGDELFIPSAGSLVSNLDGPDGEPFDSFTILTSEGQEFANLLSMIANGPVSIVFAVDLTTVPETGTDWMVSFGGRTTGGMSDVDVEFSTDGSTYQDFGTVTLDPIDTLFEVDLAEMESDTGFVRLTFAPSATDLPLIDNVEVSITLPEPGAAYTMASAMMGLVALGRIRRRRRV